MDEGPEIHVDRERADRDATSSAKACAHAVRPYLLVHSSAASAAYITSYSLYYYLPTTEVTVVANTQQ